MFSTHRKVLRRLDKTQSSCLLVWYGNDQQAVEYGQAKLMIASRNSSLTERVLEEWRHEKVNNLILEYKFTAFNLCLKLAIKN